MNETLAVRIDAANPDHHLWKNGGVYWVHYTVHVDGLRQRRVRHSLGTKNVELARARRDAELDAIRAGRRAS